MKRHTVLAAAVVPVLTLTIAVTAQAATPADTPSDPAASSEASDASTVPSHEPTELEVPSAGTSSDPADIASDEPETSPSDEPARPGDALPAQPEADLAEIEPPAAVAPSAAAAFPPATPSATAVDVLITLAATDVVPNAVLVSGYVVGVESGGTCTLTLTRGDEVRSIGEAAEPDAATTVCGGLTMSTATLTSGEWSAVVTYVSATRAGASEPTVVVVQ